MNEPLKVTPGERLEVVMRGVVNGDGHLVLDDGSIWNVLPIAAEIRRVPAGSVPYNRAVLVDILVYHYRDDIKGCGCGWNELGASWPEHIATVYEESVTGKVMPRG